MEKTIFRGRNQKQILKKNIIAKKNKKEVQEIKNQDENNEIQVEKKTMNDAKRKG